MAFRKSFQLELRQDLDHLPLALTGFFLRLYHLLAKLCSFMCLAYGGCNVFVSEAKVI